jgi:hypothetical protein
MPGSGSIDTALGGFGLDPVDLVVVAVDQGDPGRRVGGVAACGFVIRFRVAPAPSTVTSTSRRRPAGQGHPSRRRHPAHRHPPWPEPSQARRRRHLRYLDYPTALHNGWPIATGGIEGACRHIVEDRTDIIGARWGLPGAEAILKLRALRSNGDFDTYWRYHLEQERRRVHETRYLNGFPGTTDHAWRQARKVVRAHAR